MEYRINLTDDTVEKLGEVLSEPIQELEQEILQKEETIAEKDEIIAEKQAIIDAFPAIESKNITANGTYSEEGKAYSPVVVNVPPTVEVEALNVTQNGTYSQSGKAYSPVTVNVPGIVPVTSGINMSVSNQSGSNLNITALKAIGNRIGLKTLAAVNNNGYALEIFSINGDVFTSISLQGDFTNRYILRFCDIDNINYDRYSDMTTICLHGIRGSSPSIVLTAA